jgi:hypothetical protein
MICPIMGDLDRFKTQVSHGSNIAVVIGYEKMKE